MRLASFVLASISLLVQQDAEKYKQDDYLRTKAELDPDLSLPRVKTYDFIVVGGGTAGCLVAGRLSEHHNVLLLESGGTPVPTTANPFLNEFVATNPAINNIFESVPQFNFDQEGGGIVKSHTGRMLGGSGSHNGNFYNRGSPRDYDNYALLTGDPTWRYETVLNHFKSYENFIGDLIQEDSRNEFYATGGLLTVNTDMPPILPAWFQAAAELGYPTGDPNGNQTESFTPAAMSVENGERESTYTAFIKPFESTRTSLTVMRYSEVEQILINERKAAYGVIYKRHGIPQIAHALKEVIVSAGTISSPLLLMKSGIGPEAALNAAGIPVEINLPGVGKNLRDHSAVVLRFTAQNANPALLPRITDMEAAIAAYQEANRTGFLTRLDVGPQAFISSSRAKANGEANWPDHQIVFAQHGLIDDGTTNVALALQIILNRAESVGEIGFNSTNYLNGERDDKNLALIDFKLFTVLSDMEVMIEGIRLGLQIMENTTSFQQMNVAYTESTPEACQGIPYRSNQYWMCYVQQRGYSWLHIVGTCSMGLPGNPMTVVDSHYKVLGIAGLRVIDASVMPRTTNANLNGGVILVAEKGAQMILEEHNEAKKN